MNSAFIASRRMMAARSAAAFASRSAMRAQARTLSSPAISASPSVSVFDICMVPYVRHSTHRHGQRGGVSGKDGACPVSGGSFRGTRCSAWFCAVCFLCSDSAGRYVACDVRVPAGGVQSGGSVLAASCFHECGHGCYLGQEKQEKASASSLFAQASRPLPGRFAALRMHTAPTRLGCSPKSGPFFMRR